jgi:6-phosphogluconolactonase (cycloisomerase 2 family)
MVMCVAAATMVTAPPGAMAQEPELTRPLLVAHRFSDDITTMEATRDGRLRVVATGVPTGIGTRPVVVTPDGRFAFSAAREANEIWSYAVDRRGLLTPLFVTPGQDDFPFGMNISPDGRTLYVGSQGTSVISTYAINPDGSITARGPAVRSGAAHTRVMSMTPDGRFLFVGHGDPAGGDPSILTGFAVQPDGTLVQHVGPILVGTIAAGIPSITPDGRFLYLPGQLSNEVHGFGIGADGSLTSVPGSPYPASGQPFGTTITPDGRHLYVANQLEDAVHGFGIGADGSLTTVPGSPFPAGDLPVGLTTSPDGRFLYVGNFDSHDVYVYEIASEGMLTPVPGSPVPTGGSNPAARSLVFVPNREPLARFWPSPRPAGRPTGFDASASRDRDGRIARYDWNFGDGAEAWDAGPTSTHVYRDPGRYTVTLVVTDDEGCSTRLVYTGHVALCTGSPAARASHTVVVR